MRSRWCLPAGSLLLEKIIDGHAPSEYGRLCIRDVPASEDHRMLGITGLVGLDVILMQQVHIPHYLCPAGEVVSALLKHSTFRCRAVVVLAADFDGENGSAFA